MNQVRTLLSLIIMFVSMACFGQSLNDVKDLTPAIEVIGSAEKEIIPDEIYIAITIRERENGRDKITIDKQEADLKAALQEIDITLENLSLSDANANYVNVKWSKREVITKSEYVLKVADALMVGKVFEKLDELKITEAGIARVSHSKLEDYKKEVRILAIKAAKEKADYLLNAIGQETGKAIKVNEQTENNRMDDANFNVLAKRQSNYYYIDGLKMGSMDPEKIIQFEKIKLQSAIYVKFEIK